MILCRALSYEENTLDKSLLSVICWKNTAKSRDGRLWQSIRTMASQVSEVYLQYLLLIVLPVVAFVVLRQRQLPEERGDIEPKKQMAIVYLAALVVGAYDGFYGPGTGTFLLLIFCNLGKLDVRTAGGNVKLVNLSSNIASLLTSLLSGKVFLVLGLIGTVSSILGHFIGAGLAIKNGSKIVKPAIIIVLILLAAKVVQGLIAG